VPNDATEIYQFGIVDAADVDKSTWTLVSQHLSRECKISCRTRYETSTAFVRPFACHLKLTRFLLAV